MNEHHSYTGLFPWNRNDKICVETRAIRYSNLLQQASRALSKDTLEHDSPVSEASTTMLHAQSKQWVLASLRTCYSEKAPRLAPRVWFAPRSYLRPNP